MTKEVPVSEARSQLSELVNRVRFGGEQIVLTRHGKGVAALVPLEVVEAQQPPDVSSAGDAPNRVLDLGSRAAPPPGQIAARTDPW